LQPELRWVAIAVLAAHDDAMADAAISAARSSMSFRCGQIRVRIAQWQYR
jgi:hypothetical protein